MPIINDRHYMNPQYGKALERARAADEAVRRVHGEPQPSWLDHFLGFAATTDTKQGTPAQQSKSHRQTETTKATDDAIGNLIYNETAGLRPTSETGKGSQQDLHEGRVATGTVAKTLDGHHTTHNQRSEGRTELRSHRGSNTLMRISQTASRQSFTRQYGSGPIPFLSGSRS